MCQTPYRRGPPLNQRQQTGRKSGPQPGSTRGYPAALKTIGNGKAELEKVTETKLLDKTPQSIHYKE